jgi:hypothetical protein
MARKQEMTRVTDVAAFLRQGRVVKGVHSFTKRCLHWPYCAHCGLLLLRNRATERAVSQPCVRLED